MSKENSNSATVSAEPIFEISRTLNAPKEIVFDAWTDPKHLSNWWGPECFDCKCEVDLKVGGHYRFTMIGPDGSQFPMKGVYREIVKNEKLVMSIDVTDHPREWHEAVLSNMPDKTAKLHEQMMTITFVESNGKTTVKVHTLFASVAERDAFYKIGMNEGWTGSLNKLEDLVSKL